MKNVLILYSTVTGNTQFVAEYIFEKLNTQNLYKVDIQNVAEVEDINTLSNFDVIILGSSTWNDGEHTGDLDDFIARLKDSSLDISSKPFGFFGLGDTSYKKYNTSIIQICEWLQKEKKITMLLQTLFINALPDTQLEKINSWIDSISEHLNNSIN